MTSLIESKKITQLLKNVSQTVIDQMLTLASVIMADSGENFVETFEAGFVLADIANQKKVAKVLYATDLQNTSYYFVDKEANVLAKIQQLQNIAAHTGTAATPQQPKKTQPVKALGLLDPTLPSSYYFYVDLNEDKNAVVFHFTSIEYYNKEGLWCDEHGAGYDKFYDFLPEGYDDEIYESTFLSPDDFNTTIKTLLKAGFTPATQAILDDINSGSGGGYASSSCISNPPSVLNPTLPSSYYFLAVPDDQDIDFGFVTKVYVVNIDFWNNNKCLDSDGISSIVKSFMPKGYDEMEESQFGSTDDVSFANKNMVNAGFIPAPQDMIDLLGNADDDCSNCTGCNGSCGTNNHPVPLIEQDEEVLDVKTERLKMDCAYDSSFMDLLNKVVGD